MNRRLIAASGGCIGGDCPTDHLPDRGTAVVEAYVVTDRTVFAQTWPGGGRGGRRGPP